MNDDELIGRGEGEGGEEDGDVLTDEETAAIQASMVRRRVGFIG